MLRHIGTHNFRSTAGPPSAPPMVRVRGGGRFNVQERRAEAAVDEALAESFPASDPPAWNPGLARPVDAGRIVNRAVLHGPARRDARVEEPAGVIDVSRPPGSAGALVPTLAAFAGAGGIALLVPFVMLVIGLPLALAVWGLLELAQWLWAAIA